MLSFQLLVNGGSATIGAFLFHMAGISNTSLFWVIVTIFSLPSCLLIDVLEKPTVMFFTAFIGSYLSVRGVSFFLGGFPDESTMAQLI